MSEKPEPFYKQLSWRLVDSGLQQREVAEQAGLSPQYLSDLLRGSRLPTGTIARSLGDVLNDQHGRLVQSALYERCWRDGFTHEEIAALARYLELVEAQP